MVKNSFVAKILAIFLSMITIVFILLAVFISFWNKKSLLNEKINTLMVQVDILSEVSSGYVDNKDGEYIEYLTDFVDNVSKFLKVDVVLSDSLNYVYLVSNNSYGNLLGKQLEDEIYTNLKNNKEPIKSLGNNSYNISVKNGYIIKPVFDSGVYKGAVTLLFSEQFIKSGFNVVSLIVFIGMFIAILVISIIIYFIVKKIFVAPIEVINNTAKKFALGDVKKRVDIKTKGEIGELASSFNYMADSLEKIDSNRREFLSNVSHELRTPLTAIIGFLSGILDGIIPKENHIEKLKVVYDEVKRLSRLVNDLLDLTAMESGKFTLRLKTIELNSLIKYTVTNFEQEIKQNNINMEVLLESDTVNVIADEDRLIQVLNNLIANAIKYCDSKKSIVITTKLKNNKVLVSIFNTAKLLTEEEFKNIWVRFYKIDKSRTGKESTGLGLSIVRNIISQFQEEIWVENVPKEEGVSFKFTLQSCRKILS